MELNEDDAARLGIRAGDRVRVESRRGAIEVPARLGPVPAGTVFVPFLYRAGQANELTMTIWDPVSKQPLFKTAACRVTPCDS